MALGRTQDPSGRAGDICRFEIDHPNIDAHRCGPSPHATQQLDGTDLPHDTTPKFPLDTELSVRST